ncbi:O-antigen ligase family protein [Vibrio splendidus]|uniref:O-antigen ligase family protein n=1 Tax=Vibrio splendidus TaxID=29497 RepID=UPI0015E79C3B|nr:O-antigen ligase family protein [Vibrio splendidus]
MFFTISYWLEGCEKKINVVMIFFVVGTVLTCLFHSENLYKDYLGLISGRRLDYNFMNANHSAALLATSIMIMVYISSSININIKKSIVIFSLSIITIFLFTGTQSRAAYISLVIPFLILIWYSFRKSKINFFCTSLIILSVISSFVYSSLPRVSDEAKTFQKKYELNMKDGTVKDGTVKDGAPVHPQVQSNTVHLEKKSAKLEKKPTKDFSPRIEIIEILNNIASNVPYTSVGFRLHFWIDTIKQSTSNPLFGLGNNANRYILEHSNHANIYKKYNFQHLHSSYMELIASYGLIGSSLLFYLYFYVFKLARDKAPRRIVVFSFCAYSFLVVINIFESYLFVKSGVLIHTLILGILYSFNFKGDFENE